jgi:hypothetical protein
MRTLPGTGSLVILLLASIARPAAPQSHPVFEGMWGDPPVSAEDTFCAAYCTDAGLQRLGALLDDPKNDNRPYVQLSAEADNYQRDSYIRPLLTPAALRGFPLDPAKDPGFLRCEPWGLARQIFARHQLEIHARGDLLEMRYGEWDAKRIVHMAGGQRPAHPPVTPMGYSVGRYEGDALVIESDAIAPNWLAMGGLYVSEHSPQLRIVERYTRSKDGKRLLLTATIDDPQVFRMPVTAKKVWSWSPGSKIAAYTSCEPPKGLLKR